MHKIKTRYFLIAVFAITITVLSLLAYADAPAIPPTDDNGTYILSTEADLKWFRDAVNGGSLDIDAKLSNDIALTGVWTPIYSGDVLYAPYGYGGTFDGQGHTVSGLDVQSTADSDGKIGSAYVGTGLFGGVKGMVRNLGVKGSVTGGVRTGMIVGSLYAPGSVVNCRAEGTVNGKGGIVGIDNGPSSGSNRTSIYNSVFSGDVISTGNVGGIAGGMRYGSAYGCVVTAGSIIEGTSSSGVEVGGIVGSTGSKSNVVNCISRATVIGANYDVGGIIGYALGNIINCVADSVDVRGEYRVGGMVGAGSGNKIINCCASGSVTARRAGHNDDYAGGIVGGFSNYVINSYSSCALSGNITGGLAGNYCNYAYNSCYTGASKPFGNTGTTSADVQQGTPVGAVAVLADPTSLSISSTGSYKLKAYPGGNDATAADVVSLDVAVSDANIISAAVSGTTVNVTANGPGSAMAYTGMCLKSRVVVDNHKYYAYFTSENKAQGTNPYKALLPDPALFPVTYNNNYDLDHILGPTVAVLADSSIVVPVTGVTLDKTAVTVKKAQTATLTATLAPENATDRALTWTSDNESVAAVTGNNDGCVVTARAEGKAVITVTTHDGGHTATCEVTVTQQAVNPITSKDYEYQKPSEVTGEDVAADALTVKDNPASCDADVERLTEAGASGNIKDAFEGLTNPISINVLSAFALDVSHDTSASGDLTLHVKLDKGIMLNETDGFTLYALIWPQNDDGAAKFVAFPATYDADTKTVSFTIKGFTRFFSESPIIFAEVKTEEKPTPTPSESSSGCSAGFAALALLALVPIAAKKRVSR